MEGEEADPSSGDDWGEVGRMESVWSGIFCFLFLSFWLLGVEGVVVVILCL